MLSNSTLRNTMENFATKKLNEDTTEKKKNTIRPNKKI
jgi:hypothetical protein